ncbi:L-asparaginase [Labeo rohita]|uniref:asparaginase n=1 Tax=Labeo rohita TaxID=84645 RepID=A0ABQ8LV84_LABRO|nr:L-asparaginase [Labeo rohita]
MAEWKHTMSAPSSSSMTSLSRALSLTRLNQPDSFQSQKSLSRSAAGQFRRRFSSTSESPDISPNVEARVLVINTGGTIGMMYHNNVLSPEPNALVETLRKLPILHDELYAQQTRLYEYYKPPENTLVLPLSKQNKRIVYTLLEYSPLLDSCNMTTDDWATVGKDIEVPIYEMRNDGRDNLLGALLIAGQFVIPEVCLYFHHKLYRGNRVTKVDAGSFNAFTSPNLPPLANAEVDIKINWDTVWRANTTAKFTVNTQMNRNVGLLRLFPGITADTVRAFLQPPMDGIVLETYGSGNAPDNRADLLDEFRKATKRGLIMINCTQCLRGSVTTSYATGQALSDAGLVAGCDMTPEAALSKLSYMLSRNLRGEMVADLGGAKLSLSDSRFIQVIAKSLSISCKEIGDIEALEAIREMGTDLSCADYDGRTPLHISACEGHLNVVEYLLGKGATVYAKDRFGDTPLRNAVRFSLAASGDLEALEIWQLAGVDMTMCSYDGQTPIEVARATGCKEVVEFLKQAALYQTQHQTDEGNKPVFEEDEEENGEYIEFTACPRS